MARVKNLFATKLHRKNDAKSDAAIFLIPTCRYHNLVATSPTRPDRNLNDIGVAMNLERGMPSIIIEPDLTEPGLKESVMKSSQESKIRKMKRDRKIVPMPDSLDRIESEWILETYLKIKERGL